MIAKEYLSEAECDSLKGKYLDDTSYDTLITDNCDCFREDGTILFKFRKSIFDKNECELGFLAYKGLAKSTRGRGAAAGPIDPEAQYWKRRTITKISKNGVSAKYEVDGKQSSMSVQNEVASNAMGYWSDTKGLGKPLPCRLTFHTRKEFLKFEDGKFIAQKISNSYQRLHPETYAKQVKQASRCPTMLIGDTPFSTITVNRNFRTAVHKDAGDYGFGNLSVFEYGNYHGGYFVLPKYRIAIDMRGGDHLCVDVHEHHGNTELYETDEDKLLNDELPVITKDNLEIGILGLNNRFTRISLVCYLRDKLKECELPIQQKLLHYETPPETKITVIFINKLENSEARQKYFTTNYVRCSSHTSAIKRIIKHKLKNVIVIDDTFVSSRYIGNSKQFTKKDGITFLNIVSDNLKGIYDLETEQSDLAYYIPDSHIAEMMLSEQHIPKYQIVPNMFTKTI